MKIGYARISTKEQSFNMQIDALQEFGCLKIYKDASSGVNTSRPQFDDMMNNFREGDTLVIWKLDRLGRNLKHLVSVVEELTERGIGFVSLKDPIDTTTIQGRLVFNIFAALAEFEREIIRERTMAGLKAARARGRVGGRPKGLSKEAKKTAMAAELLYKNMDIPISEMCSQLGISRTTFYKYLRHQGVRIGGY